MANQPPERVLEARWPMIPWAGPLYVATPTARGYACRYCVAIFGLKAENVGTLPQTERDFYAHLRAHHPDGGSGGDAPF